MFIVREIFIENCIMKHKTFLEQLVKQNNYINL